jgi:hypothetical protein
MPFRKTFEFFIAATNKKFKYSPARRGYKVTKDGLFELAI